MSFCMCLTQAPIPHRHSPRISSFLRRFFWILFCLLCCCLIYHPVRSTRGALDMDIIHISHPANHKWLKTCHVGTVAFRVPKIIQHHSWNDLTIISLGVYFWIEVIHKIKGKKDTILCLNSSNYLKVWVAMLLMKSHAGWPAVQVLAVRRG